MTDHITNAVEKLEQSVAKMAANVEFAQPKKPEKNEQEVSRKHVAYLRDLKNAELTRNVYRLVVENGAKLEDILKPEFWLHISSRLGPFDRIEIMPKDGSFWSEFIVMAAGNGWAKVYNLSWHTLGTGAIEAMNMQQRHSSHEIIWRGPVEQFCVMRKSDQKVVHTGEKQYTGAEAWLNNHLKALR